MKRTPFLPICAALFLSVALGACDKEEPQREPIALPATINLAGLGVTLSDQGFTADGFEFDAYRAQSQPNGVLLAYPTNNVASSIEVDLSMAEGLERISIGLFNNFDPEITYWNNGQLIGQVPLPIVYGEVVVVIDSLAGQPITSLRIASAETTVKTIILE